VEFKILPSETAACLAQSGRAAWLCTKDKYNLPMLSPVYTHWRQVKSILLAYDFVSYAGMALNTTANRAESHCWACLSGRQGFYKLFYNLKKGR
jgi:hypothetical protein